MAYVGQVVQVVGLQCVDRARIAVVEQHDLEALSRAGANAELARYVRDGTRMLRDYLAEQLDRLFTLFTRPAGSRSA
jgi:hypothetical protein